MPGSLPTALKLLLVPPVAIGLTVVSSGYKQPWFCGAAPSYRTSPGKCQPGEQTAGFPFTVLRDTFGSSPTGGFGKIDESDWVNGGLEIRGFLLNTLIYSCLLYALLFIFSLKD